MFIKLLLYRWFGGPVTNDEISTIWTTIKAGKASGVDGLFPEFFLNMGDRARNWLRKFYTKCYSEITFPKIWKRSQFSNPVRTKRSQRIIDQYLCCVLATKLWNESSIIELLTRCIHLYRRIKLVLCQIEAVVIKCWL